jgi:hypothetical protein
LFPGEEPVQAARGEWVRWTYLGDPRAGIQYGDFLYFHDGALVVALVRRVGGRYSGAVASLGPFADR